MAGSHLSFFTTSGDEHPFPLELHDFSGCQLSIEQAGDFLFTAFIDWAQPVRDDLALLQDLERSIESIRTTKATQTSVDLVAAAVATRASQISVDNLVFQVAAIQAQVGSAEASILGVLASHSTDLAAVNATLAQVLANQAGINEKLDIIISRLPKK